MYTGYKTTNKIKVPEQVLHPLLKQGKAVFWQWLAACAIDEGLSGWPMSLPKELHSRLHAVWPYWYR